MGNMFGSFQQLSQQQLALSQQGLQGLGQQRLGQQTSNYGTLTTWDSFTSSNTNIVYTSAGTVYPFQSFIPAPDPRSSDMQWLDKRVDEIRCKL